MLANFPTPSRISWSCCPRLGFIRQVRQAGIFQRHPPSVSILAQARDWPHLPHLSGPGHPARGVDGGRGCTTDDGPAGTTRSWEVTEGGSMDGDTVLGNRFYSLGSGGLPVETSFRGPKGGSR